MQRKGTIDRRRPAPSGALASQAGSFERAVGGEGDAPTLAKVRDILDQAAREIETAWPEAGTAEPQES